MMFLVQPFYGMLADRFGYKKCLLFSSFLASLSYALYVFHEGNFAYLFVITVFMALFYNTLQPVLDSLSLQLAESNPKFSYGTLRIAGAAGWAFTGIINGQLIDAISTTAIFGIACVSMFLTFLFSFSLNKDHKRSASSEDSFKNAKQVFENKTLMILLLCIFLVSATATTIWNFYSIYMKENGASASLVGFGLSFQGLCELPLFYFSAKIIARLGIRTTLVITVFTTSLRMLLYRVTKDPHAAIFIELLHGISWSLFWVVCVEYVNMLVKEDWRATGQSLLYAAYYGAGAIAGNFWTGYLYGTKMKIAEIFLLNAGIAAIVGLFIWIFVNNRRLNPKKQL